MYEMKQTGWMELICGSMFSGKSEELIRRVRRAVFAKQSIAVFKPAIDNRYSEEAVVSHNGSSVIAKSITHSSKIFEHIDNLRLDRYVERRNGFVANDQLGFECKSTCYTNTLSLSARKFVRISFEIMRLQTTSFHYA